MHRFAPKSRRTGNPAAKRQHTGPRHLPGTAPLCLVAILGAFAVTGAAAAEPPAIRLFPTTVVENVKETGRVARDMETSLQDIIGELDRQWQLYRESKCEGADDDSGCQQIAQQLGEKYLEMLSHMEAELPRIEASVQATSDSLERRLSLELGQKMTARGLQQVLVNESSRHTRLPAARGGRRSGGRLSERFRQYYRLVVQADTGGGGSVALVAADIYLDSKEVLQLIRLTRDEINRSKLMIELRNGFGTVTPEMSQVVGGVRNVLFGEEDDLTTGEAMPPAGTFPAEYRSPLEE
ncbi:MAG: hypothetical protein QNJ82_00090 [Gammaproteobacteria bacterium]|nr:hypothetical protein [Gammaproteobacteria bacterium]